MKSLGETFDIHGGGADLIFPHHENEIAQSECATGKPFARYWVHNGFVNIQAEKMSKSLGNVLAVRDLLSHVTPDALKIFLLGTQYRAPLDFSWEALTGAGRAEERFRNALAKIHRLPEYRSLNDDSTQVDFPIVRQIREAEQEFVGAMDDDFNTPRALAVLFNLTRDINVALRDAERESDKALFGALCLAGEVLRRLGWVLGGLLETLLETLEVRVFSDIAVTSRVQVSVFRTAQDAVEAAIASGWSLPRDEINIIVEYRRQRRDEKDWATADDIRAWLADRGVIVDDTAQGARWRLKTSRS